MARPSEGKRKTKNKAKVASPAQAQADSRLSRKPPGLSRSPNGKSASSSQAMRSQVDSPATGPSDGADLARFEYDPPSQMRIRPEAGEREELSTPSVQVATRETPRETHGDDVHRRIAARAFLFYAEGGFQHGHDLDHWLEAEREIVES